MMLKHEWGCEAAPDRLTAQAPYDDKMLVPGFAADVCDKEGLLEGTLLIAIIWHLLNVFFYIFFTPESHQLNTYI